MHILESANRAREAAGLLSVEDVAQLVERGNQVFDPFSVLISHTVQIGSGNTFYPSVTLMAGGPDLLAIGDGNTFHANTTISADTGPITVGHHNIFGEGGFVAKANRPGAKIRIGDHGRYLGGGAVYGDCHLESGSQILGPVTLDGCQLAAGGSFETNDPDQRAGLVKGSGRARNITVEPGFVVVLNGDFQSTDLHRQSEFHPKRGA
ncbi:MAG: AraC family transcriptional regulator [Hyphomicrobiaceae bacterium]